MYRVRHPGVCPELATTVANALILVELDGKQHFLFTKPVHCKWLLLKGTLT